jgi:uncharacterized damage-inducible protein DinB
MASEIDRLVDLFERTNSGDAWHGPSVREALDGVTARGAAAHPIAGAHSIWELVLHVTGWRGEVVRRLQGHEASEPMEGDWPVPAETTDAHWREALAALDRSHREVVTAVRRFDAARLDERIVDRRDPSSGGLGASYAVTLHGLVHHDLYHAGQVSLLKRALQGRA